MDCEPIFLKYLKISPCYIRDHIRRYRFRSHRSALGILIWINTPFSGVKNFPHCLLKNIIHTQWLLFLNMSLEAHTFFFFDLPTHFFSIPSSLNKNLHIDDYLFFVFVNPEPVQNQSCKEKRTSISYSIIRSARNRIFSRSVQTWIMQSPRFCVWHVDRGWHLVGEYPVVVSWH